MNKFKNSKTAKAVAGFVGLAAVFMMVGPSLASADTSYVFTKTLKTGVTDQEVMNLQTVLNSSADTQVAASGVGSKGMETKYFGGLTKAAVIKFQEKYASDILTPNGLTKGTGLVGASTRAKLNSMGAVTTTGSNGTTSMVPGCTSTTGYSPTTGQPCSAMTASTTAVGTGLSASLDASSPMASTLITPQGVATFATFKLTNPSSAPLKVTMLKFKRTGISSDSTLNNVYLYSGSARITDSASVSQGNISFSDASGLITVPAMSSVMVSVRADVAAGVNGQTLGMMLTDGMTDGGSVGGLPVSGAQMMFAAAPVGMTTADFTGSFSPVGPGPVDPQTDYVVWQKNLQIGNRDALMSSIRFQQIGSVYAADIKNFRLMIDGTQVGTSVDQADSNRFVTFSWATPVTLRAGNHTVKLMADIVGGSSRNFNFSLRRVVDVEIWDSQLGVVATPTVGSAAFTTVGMQSTSAVGIAAGTLTTTKDTSSPSGNIVLNGSNVTYAKFGLKAAGEELKVENLTVSWAGVSSVPTSGAASSTAKIRSGSLYADGVQIGSTQDISPAGTVFNLGSSLVLMPGKTTVLEVRGDVFNNGTGGAFVAGDSITVSLNQGSANAYQRSSLGYINAPGSTVAGNQLTVSSGSITGSTYSAYSNQTVTVPQTAYKIGEYRITAGNSEGVNLDTVTVGFGGSAVLTNVNDVYVVYNGKTSTSKATVSGTSTYSINEPLVANGTMSFAVYANLNANVTGSLVTTLAVSGTSQSSGNAVSSTYTVGQTITVGSGVLTVAADASTPVSALVVGNTMPKVGSFKFTGLNDSFTIDELTLQLLGGAADAAAIKNIVVKDGATTLATTPVNVNTLRATSTGLTVTLPYNTNKILDVYADLGNIGTGGASTGANVGVKLASYEYLTSNGQKTRVYGVATATNPFYVYKTKPTITNVALPTTVLTAGTQTLYQFSITADAGGTIAWQKLKFTVATTSGVTVSNFNIYDAANQSTPLTGFASPLSFNSATGVVTASSTIDQEVSGSKTYVLKATVGGTIASGASVSTNIAASGVSFVAPTDVVTVAGTAANFVWSDEAVIGHSGTTADWNNDYLVKNLPTDSETLTK